MSAYLKFFQLECSPFDTGSQSSVVLGTRALRDAYAQIEAGLREQAPRICVDGGSGLGKTSLARAMPKLLREQAKVVLLLNPALSWTTLKAAIVRQLDLAGGVLSRTSLAERRQSGQRIVLVIDAAEKISSESLEHLDLLLAYRTDDDEQLVQCVLLANLENARQQPDCPLLWWLDSLNTLQLEFAPIPVDGVRSYIVKHLKRAGWTGGDLFSADAARAIHRLTGGVPRSVSELCERVLTEAAAQEVERIDARFVEVVCGERAAGAPTGRGDEGLEEVVLEEVAVPPSRPRAATRHDVAEAHAAGGDVRATRSDPRVDPAPARPPSSQRAGGLDAYFGPEAQAASATALANLAVTEEGSGAAFGPEAVARPDATARRGIARWLAAAAVLLVVAGAGLYFALVAPGDEAGETPTAQTEAPVPSDAARGTAKPPSPAERLARQAAKAGPQRADDVALGKRTGKKKASGLAAGAKAPAAQDEARFDLVFATSATPDDTEPLDPHSTPPAPPASPASLSPMERSNERHF